MRVAKDRNGDFLIGRDGERVNSAHALMKCLGRVFHTATGSFNLLTLRKTWTLDA
jgi:hypothetical protein